MREAPTLVKDVKDTAAGLRLYTYDRPMQYYKGDPEANEGARRGRWRNSPLHFTFTFSY